MAKKRQNGKGQTLIHQPQPSVISHAEMTYSGPLPLPQHLEKYEDVCPGAADRIIAMAEGQAKHRQEMESTVIQANGRNSTLGVLIGGMVAVLAIVYGAHIIESGYEISGYVTMFVPLATLVGIFIYGKRENRKELIEKQKLMEMYSSSRRNRTKRSCRYSFVFMPVDNFRFLPTGILTDIYFRFTSLFLLESVVY